MTMMAPRPRVYRTSLALTLLWALGCQQPPAAPTQSTAPTQGAAILPQRGLALMTLTGDLPVDRELRRLQDAARRDVDRADPWIALGRAFVRKAREAADPGFYRNADACVDLALALEPDNAAALSLRGIVLMNDHRFSEARALAQRVLRLRPDDAMAWGTLGDAELELGSYDEAGAALRRMMALKPNLPSYLRTSYLAWLRGDGAAALVAARHAIDASSLSSKDPEPRAYALTQAAAYFWHRGDYEGAEAGANLALQHFPGYPEALALRGRAALAQGRYAQAAELLAKAYEQSPKIDTGWLLGDARQLAGDAAGAKAAYERIERQGRRLDPRTLGLYLASKDKDIPQALELLKKELAERKDIYTQDAYALALLRAGQAKDAWATAQQALRLGTKDAALLAHAGACALAAGEREAGQRLLREALALNPGFDVYGAREARRLLGEGEKGALAQAGGAR